MLCGPGGYVAKKHGVDEVRAQLAKAVREVARQHGVELDEKGDVRLSTPSLAKDDDSDYWESADGLAIPKGKSPERQKWDKSFLGRLHEVFGGGKKLKRIKV